MKNLCSFVTCSLALLLICCDNGFAQTVVQGVPLSRAIPIPAQIPAKIPAQIPAEIRAQIESQQAAIAAGQIPGGTITATAQASPDAVAADRETQKQERLAKLASLTFNRLPSNILETWYKSEQDPQNADLPPAPADSFLYSDVRFQIAIEQLQKDFTMGNWDAIAAFMKQIPEANAKIVYQQVLAAAAGTNASKLQGAQSGGSRVDPRTLQPQYLTFSDIFSIARIAPVEIEKQHLNQLSAAFRQVISRGNSLDDLLTMFNEELENETPVFDKRQIAKILFGTGQPIQAGKYLPDLETATRQKDHEALNLLSRHYLAIYQQDRKTADLEQAWHVTQAILSSGDVDKDERKLALQRAVQLSKDVNEELGQKWLNDSFVAQPETGMEVLGAIGADASKSLKDHARSAEVRQQRLKLQNDAVNALLDVSEEQAKNWKHPLELLALNWLREAQISYSDDNSTQIGPQMQRDMYGNIFYFNANGGMSSSPSFSRNGLVAAIKTSDLLETKPSDKWLALIDPTLRPKFDAIMAQLYLKVSEQDLALPYIEKLASAHPKQAESLIDEFVTVWTRNHNPNNDRRRTNSYMFMYGFESRAESIPLTRSKQERNLEELAQLVARLENLVDKELDEKLLVEAFVTCHSTAEVYELEKIEKVFGPVAEMKPETIASLTARMRTNLATMWRDANVQKDKKTKRKKKEIEQEVIDGYELARKLVQDALEKHPEEWTLVTTNAELLHDENNYRAELKNSSDFSPRRREAMDLFRTAAEMYAAKMPDLEEKDYSTRAFETWYYASLGACDLGLIEDQHRVDPKQAALIRTAIESLPEKASQWHMSRFANLLFNRMSSVKPQLKHKYLDVGFEIVGDNKQAAEARKVHDYYKDLVSEIKLVASIDGDTRVGHDQPFGVQINLLHTKEIERESGGFGRYLQNQNGNVNFSYNYGRPTEDYRDKFEEAVRESYSAQFDVLSVTFQKPDVKSIPAREEGWRITPYAYLLLKAKGPEVDKIPPAKLDLDFLDTSGYAILPVESPALPIDASERVSRPFQNLVLNQILDERQSDEGKLILEIKASAQGLVPDLEEMMTIAPAEFEIAEIDDPGVSVSQFDPDERKPTVNSERNWLVSLQAKPGLPTKPKTFSFPSPDVEANDAVYQRYVDADLASVEGTVNLEEKYGKTSTAWMIYTGVGVFLFGVMFLGGVIYFATRPKTEHSKSRFELGEDLSPFAAISLLQDIHANNGLSEGKRDELAEAIKRLEAHFFGQMDAVETPDLANEVKKWAKHSNLAV